MSNMKTTSRSGTRLEKVLRHFENAIGSSSGTLEEHLEEYAQKRAEHPGLYFLGDLQLQYFALAPFHDAAKKALVASEDLPRTSSLVHAFYTISAGENDTTLHNPFLQITGEPEAPYFLASKSYELLQSELPQYENSFTEEMEMDLKRCAPNVTRAKVLKLQSEIKNLEARRMGILATMALLARKDTGSQEYEMQKADMMRRLLRYWSGFKKSFYEIFQSDALGDLALAINETRKNISSRASPLSLAALPQRLYFRYKDYVQGRGDLKFAEELHRPLDTVTGEIGGEEKSPVAVIENADSIELKLAIAKLSLSEQNAVKKRLRGEMLNQTERQTMHRALPKLKTMLS